MLSQNKVLVAASCGLLISLVAGSVALAGAPTAWSVPSATELPNGTIINGSGAAQTRANVQTRTQVDRQPTRVNTTQTIPTSGGTTRTVTRSGQVIYAGDGDPDQAVGSFTPEEGADMGARTSTTVTTTTTTAREQTQNTTTVAPPPPVVVKPCEIIDSCDKLKTLNMIQAIQQKQALLQARKTLEQTRLEIQKIRCEASQGCQQRGAPEPRLSTTQIAILTRANAQPDNVFVTSILGSAGDYQAILEMEGAHFPVAVGDPLPGGMKVVGISPRTVSVMRNGNRFVLPVSGRRSSDEEDS